MKRKLLPILAVCALIVALWSCSKELKVQLVQSRELKAELEGQVKDLPEISGIETCGFGIRFDKEYYWVDAGGSITVNYEMSSPGSVAVVAGDGWSSTVTQAQDDKGSIFVSAPDPAAPIILTVSAGDVSGHTIERFVQVFVRKPYNMSAVPRIETMGYNGFSDELATEENFRKLAESGITIITVEGDWEPWIDWRKQCRLAGKYGIKVVLFINGTAGDYSADPDNYKGLDQKVLEAETYPAVCAYQIADEPSTVQARTLAIAKSRIEQLAPNHPVYINLHPASVSQLGMGAATYADYVEHFASVCDLKFITFDQYPVFKWGVEDSWFTALDVVSSTARRHGIPFWAFLLCSREPGRVDPDLCNIRLQGNVDLMYGAQCIQFFVWKAHSATDYAPIMNDGEYKPVYYDCKEYNRELHNREFVFAGGNVWKVRHTGLESYKHGTALTQDDYPEAISDMSIAGDALISFVGNHGNEYVAVCNKSWKEKLPVGLTFSRTVYTIDRNGGFTEQQPGTSAFEIDEGDMLIVKWR